MKTVLTRVDGVDYEYAQAYGYLTKGRVKRLIDRGWEPVNYTPAVIAGMSLAQGMHTLRRRVVVDA